MAIIHNTVNTKYETNDNSLAAAVWLPVYNMNVECWAMNG